MMRLKIAQGRLYDPTQGWEGEVGDLYVEGDRIVAPLPEVDRVIDAQGQMVVAGGIELRGQVATYGLNYLRLWGLLPSAREIGELYASLGFTHVHEPFLTLYTAKYTHRELAALPVVDTSASLTLNIRDLDKWLRLPEQLGEVGQNLQFLLEQTRSLNLRIMEPYVRFRQDYFAHRNIRTEEILEILATLAQSHNLTLTLEASPGIIRLPLPAPTAFHLAALGPALIEDDLVEATLGHLEKGTTVDLGLMPPKGSQNFANLPVQINLGFFHPLNLCPPHSPAAAQRALVLALKYQGTNLAFSGAGSFLTPISQYSRIFSWLADQGARRQDWGDSLPSREYSLAEWVRMTRTLPAQLLGLTERGHLGVGARADIAVYDLPGADKRINWGQSLSRCRFLLKAGETVIDNFNLVKPEISKATYYLQTGIEASPWLKEVCQYRSFRLENLWVHDHLVNHWIGI
ncbi:MAG: amidohydrolase family protein [Deltaproteobacteria bacterium]|nr:amidohydrolase family protein [Deltaproteobacteria bacterium]